MQVLYSAFLVLNPWRLFCIALVFETNYGKTRRAQIKTSVFATSNNLKKLSAPLQHLSLFQKTRLLMASQIYDNDQGIKYVETLSTYTKLLLTRTNLFIYE